MLYLAMIENGMANFIVIITAILVMILFLLTIIVQSKNILHMIQLSSYNVDQYKIWIKNNKKSFRINKLLLFITILLTITEVVYLYYGIANEAIGASVMAIVFLPIFLEIICIIFAIIIVIKAFIHRKKKKKLAYTDRIKRNITCNALIYIFIIASLFIINAIYEIEGLAIWIESILAAIFIIVAPMITYLSFLIMLPLENGIKKKIIDKAKAKLKKDCRARVVGITGSFGKTSVKNFLYKLLSIKYNTCISPESYNVPMGACITINEHLKSYDEIFVQEMGARRVGDIKEMCDIVEPKDAIITEVGEMHLDTFKSIENVLKTKMELVEDVVARWKDNGGDNNGKNSGDNSCAIVLNGDNQLIRDYVVKSSWNNDKDIIKNIYFVGENQDNDFIIENIVGTKDGASFDLRIGERAYKRIGIENKLINVNNLVSENDGNGNFGGGNFASGNKIFNFNTKLIGKNNILDISLAVAFALLKDIDIGDIKSEVRKLEQVKARLEIMNIDENTIIVNDGYNSNPVGAKNAIDAVATFDGYKKIIVTPGMVELGDKQYEENKKMASYAVEKLDEVVIVGNANKGALMDGVGGNAKFFISEEEAINYAREQQAKKIILLENDITDNY